MVLVGNCVSLLVPLRQFLQLRPSQGRVNIGQAIVEAERSHVVGKRACSCSLMVIGINSVIAETSQVAIKLRIVGDDHTAFACRHRFDGMKAIASHVGPLSNVAAKRRRANAMATVGDQKSVRADWRFVGESNNRKADRRNPSQRSLWFATKSCEPRPPCPTTSSLD